MVGVSSGGRKQTAGVSSGVGSAVVGSAVVVVGVGVVSGGHQHECLARAVVGIISGRLEKRCV